ncbi:MAG: type II secretion system protein F [Hyphomicrobiaceae bacterium]|jgi:type II secretion system protein F
MTSYSYRATTRDGRVVEGVIEAAGEAGVVAALRSQGYIPLSIRAGTGGAGAGAGSKFSMAMPSFGAGRVKNRDLMLFTRELATLLNAGLPLDRSLHSLAALTENAKLKSVVAEVLSSVQGGKSLSQALADQPDVFPPLFFNMIRAGEAGGMVETVLERLADYLERNQTVRDEVKSALSYPIILALVASGAITILLVYVLPKFATLFDELGTAMPASTQFVMGASDLLQRYWWLGGILIAAAVLGVRQYRQTPAGQLKWDGWSLNAPLIGGLTSKIQIARFARTLGTMLQGGVPLIRALEIVRTVVGNQVINEAVGVVQREVSEGKGLGGPLESVGVFPPLAIQMVAVGEETGRLDEMLLVVADHFDREVTNTVNSLMALVGPFILVVMGGIAGFIVIAMMSAVFSVNEMQF